MNKIVRIYATENCPRCRDLEVYLEQAHHIQAEKVDMADPEWLTELRCAGVHSMEAPVLQAGEKFYATDRLFNSGGLNKDIVDKIAWSV